MLDWKAIEEQYNNFKAFAPDGIYDARLAGVELKIAGQNNTPWLSFKFEDVDNGAIPAIRHAISGKNINWRAWHTRQLLNVIGATDEKAKEIAEQAEAKGDKAPEFYQQKFDSVAKHYKPTLKIKVFTETANNGKAYARAEFIDTRVAMDSGDNKNKPNEVTDKVADIMGGGEPVKTDDLPF